MNLNPAKYNANVVSGSDVKIDKRKGKEVSSVDMGGDEWNCKFVPYDDDEPSSIEQHSKELSSLGHGDDDSVSGTQWGKDWWWRQEGSGELCSKDYVKEWIGSQICPGANPDSDEEKKSIPERVDQLEKFEDHLKGFEKNKERKGRKKSRKMKEWWKEEHLDEIRKKGGSRIKNLETKWQRRGFKIAHVDLGRRFRFRTRKKTAEQNRNDAEHNGGFSFRRGWKRKNGESMGSEDLFSRELSSTTSMRGTLCYVAPEYGGGCVYLMEKGDIYSLGVLMLVIVSGRRPLQVLASPMKLEKANLISWCRQLAQSGNILELVDERMKEDYNKEQVRLCINVALMCLQKMPELRPDIGDIVKILKGDMDLPPLLFEFSPSPPSKWFSRSKRRQKTNSE